MRVFRLSRIRAKVSYATKAEHDFAPPEDFDRRDYASRADWQMGEIGGTGRVFLRERIAWLVERDFGAYGKLRKPTKQDGVRGRGAIYETEYASARQLISWVLGWRENATLLEPEDLAREATERLELLRKRHSGKFTVARDGLPAAGRETAAGPGQRQAALRERSLGVRDPAGAIRPAGDSRGPADRRRSRGRRGCPWTQFWTS